MLVSVAGGGESDKIELILKTAVYGMFLCSCGLFASDENYLSIILLSMDVILVALALFRNVNFKIASLAAGVGVLIYLVFVYAELTGEGGYKLLPVSNAMLCSFAIADILKSDISNLKSIFFGMALAMLFLAIN